ncbi:unnamed protein product [Mucor circinelloides]
MSLLDPIISNIETIDSSYSTVNYSQTSLTPPPDTSFVKLNIGSLNCRGLNKTAATSIRSQFIRYLRIRSLDLLALQETHASSSSLQDMFHSRFQAKSSIWSPHCGLVSFSSDISFSNSIVSICGRIISTTISHSSDAFEPFSITVVYLPASRSERFHFLSFILTDFRSVFSSSPSCSIILGDFNYTYSNASSSRNRQAHVAGCSTLMIISLMASRHRETLLLLLSSVESPNPVLITSCCLMTWLRLPPLIIVTRRIFNLPGLITF